MEAVNTAAGRQVELIIRKLNSLSTLPSVAANFLPLLLDRDGGQSLAEIVNADVALAAKILSLAQARGIETDSVPKAFDSLPYSVVRDAILSIKVWQAFEPEYDPDSKRQLPRRELALHAFAVACCCRELAGIVKPAIDAELAFSAGLLHDIGKLAIDEVMPKSFEQIVREAREEKISSRIAESKNLGIDHCIIGKRLAQRWNLPEAIGNAIWLHHSPCEIAAATEHNELAAIVSIADAVVRGLGLGDSGSYDCPQCEDLYARLGISTEQVEEIASRLPRQVTQKAQRLGLAGGGAAKYLQSIQTAAAQFASSNTKLADESVELQKTAMGYNFITELFKTVSPKTTPIDIAAELAAKLRKFYSLSAVAAIVCNSRNSEPSEGVLLANSAQAIFSLVRIAGATGLPESIEPASVEQCGSWLIDNFGTEFDPDTALGAALRMSGKTIGYVFIQQQYRPIGIGVPGFAGIASAAATVLALARSYEEQQLLAERITTTLGRLKESEEECAAARSMLAVAEIAAGAAHELNNPLAVISGRAQLLAGSETDQNRKQMLAQIQDRAAEMTSMISDLMAYAKPAAPNRQTIDVATLVGDAVADVKKSLDAADVEITVNIADGASTVLADPAQLRQAITYVICNALESYPANRGPVEISAQTGGTGIVEIRIIDHGCGMDSQTLAKAAHPFFSGKAAGRKRGMGLAHAQRFVQINGGTLRITSRPGDGTTVILRILSR